MTAKLKRVNCYTKYFHGGVITTQLICKGNKIVVTFVSKSTH